MRGLFHRPQGVAAAAVILISSLFVPAIATAVTPTVYYFSPTGTGVSPCAASNPCALTAATISGAPAGSELVLAKGNYAIADAITLSNFKYLHGAASARDVVITSSAQWPITASTSRISDLTLISTSNLGGGALSLTYGSLAERVIVRRTSGPGTGVRLCEGATNTLRNSIASNNSNAGATVAADSAWCFGSAIGVMEHVTVINDSTGPALEADSSASRSVTLIVRDSIMLNSGPAGSDLSFNKFAGEMAVAIGGFVYRTPITQINGAPLPINLGGNTTTVPTFVNRASGDLHLTSDSSAVDAVGRDSGLELDIDGDPRWIGGAEDVGADEFRTPPTGVTTDAATLVGPTGAQLNGTFDGEGLGGSYYFEYGPTTAYGSSTPPRDFKPLTTSATATIGGLSASSAMSFRLVVETPGGKVFGANQTFTTTDPVTVPGPTATATVSATATVTATPVNSAPISLPAPLPKLSGLAVKKSVLSYSVDQPATLMVVVKRGTRTKATIYKAVPVGVGKLRLAAGKGKKLKKGQYSVSVTVLGGASGPATLVKFAVK